MLYNKENRLIVGQWLDSKIMKLVSTLNNSNINLRNLFFIRSDYQFITYFLSLAYLNPTYEVPLSAGNTWLVLSVMHEGSFLQFSLPR